MHDVPEKTAEIKIKQPSQRARAGAIVAAVIAAVATVVIMNVSVSWNKSSAQSGTGSAATADTTLGPGGTHTCTAADVGKVVGCVATTTTPLTVPVDPDTDGDGIVDSADKCVDKPEDKDGVDDTDGCPELTDAERILLLEKQMKGQKGQWDAIAALKGRMTSVEDRVQALEAWQKTINGALRVAGANSKRVVQTTDVFVVNGKQLDNLPPEVRKAIADAAGTK